MSKETTMKMPADIYAKMKNDIRTVVDALGIDLATADGGKTGLKTMYLMLDFVSRNRSFDDTHPGFKDGHWNRLLPFDGREFCFYYTAGCHDTHVATALKNIKAELIAEKPAKV